MGMILKYNFIGIVKYFFKNKILYVIDIWEFLYEI